MLQSGELLADIALACGFADQAHFSTIFRREVGETPSAWRRRNQTDAPARRGAGEARCSALAAAATVRAGSGVGVRFAPDRRIVGAPEIART